MSKRDIRGGTPDSNDGAGKRKIRKIFADQDNLKEMLATNVKPDLELDDKYVFLPFDWANEGVGYYAWNRNVALASPDQMEAYAEMPDFDGIVAAQLSDYVQGLDQCLLRISIGRLWEERRDGGQVFELYGKQRILANGYAQAMVCVCWRPECPPVYDMSLDGKFAKRFDIRCISRIDDKEGISWNGFAFDVWVLDLDRLAPEFFVSAYHSCESAIAAWQYKWDEFDLSREYFHEQMKPYAEELRGVRLTAEESDDYMRLYLDRNAVKAAMEAQDGTATKEQDETETTTEWHSPVIYCWYNREGLQRIRRICQGLVPSLAMHRLLGSLVACFGNNSATDEQENAEMEEQNG